MNPHTPLLDDLREMLAIVPVTHMRVPTAYAHEITRELEAGGHGEYAPTLGPGDIYQVSFRPSGKQITLELF